jgi:HEAT repeat protein
MRTPLFAALAAVLGLTSPRGTAAATSAALAAVVADCRRLDADAPLEKQERFAAASQVLVTAGEEGVRAVEAELAALRAAKETDVIFQSLAAEVILAVREGNGFAAALEAVRGIDPRRDLRHLWPTLTVAAASRDPRALLLLRVALATDEESAPTIFPRHAMNVPWPHTLDFLYGAFGQGACADLVQLATRPPTPREDASIAFVLAQLDCPGAAAALRPWVAGKDEGRVAAALRALGRIGDPADAGEFLGCAARPEVEIRRACAYGLWELSVPATTPAIRRLLDDASDLVRLEAISAAFHLADEDGMAAVIRRRKAAKGEEAARIDGFVGDLAKDVGMQASALAAGDAAAWRKALAAYWKRRDHFFDRKPGDPALSRVELEKLLARSEKEGRVEAHGAGELRAVLGVARAEDLPAIHAARGRVLLRQSDECLDEARWLERIARVVHRRAVRNPKPNE